MFFRILTLVSFLGLCHAQLLGMQMVGDFQLLDDRYVGINFFGSDLSRAKFIGQNLSGVDFRDANLSGANLIGTILTNAKMNENTNFSGAIGWKGVLHIKPGNAFNISHAGITLPTISTISGHQIEVTKEWLLKQGVIFDN